MNEKRNIYKWIISVGLVILLFFLIDLFVINETLLTPYEELRPTSLPTKDIKTGTYYLVDKTTAKTYTLDQNKNLVSYNKQSGEIKALGDESSRIKLSSRGLVYLHPPVSPFYSFYLPEFSSRILLPIILIGLFLFLFFKFIEIPDDKPGIKLFLLFLFTIFIRASFAWLRHDFNQMGIELLRYSGESVLFDVPGITNIFEFLKNYPQKMAALSMNGSHYPPGFALLLKLITIIGGYSTMAGIKANINTIGWIIIILGSTSIYPLYLIAKELFNKKTAIIATAIFIFIPNTTIYGAVSLNAIFVVLALWPVYFLLKADTNGKTFLYSALMGLSLGLTVFFSFTGLPVGLLIVIFILLQMLQSKENFFQYFRISAFAAIGFFSFISFLYITFGFNLLQCFLNAKELESSFMAEVTSRYHGKSLTDLSVYITWGNYLAFAIYAGFHNIALFLRNVKSSVCNGIKNLNDAKIFSIAVFVLIVIIGTSFVYHMETERIWQFISAFLAIIIAGELFKIKSISAKKHVLLLILGISSISTIILESLLFTLW